MEKPVHDCLILSDLHLGSETSRAREALRLLRSLRFRRLILLGDIFCDLNFRRLRKEHWRFLSHIRKLSNPKRNVQVIWVEGNHDRGLVEVMSHLVGVPVYREYVWEEAGIRHLALHGDQFDGFITTHGPVASSIITSIYLAFQKLDRGSKQFSRMLDRWNTQWQRLTPDVANGAMRYAESRNAARVYCGHTHEPLQVSQNGIQYYNAGAWTNAVPTYITVDGQESKIHEYLERTDDRYPREKRRETTAKAPGLTGAPGLLAPAHYESLPG
jgi:UDP-2,3-diacylglucosamine pyrophosphatase LpxH